MTKREYERDYKRELRIQYREKLMEYKSQKRESKISKIKKAALSNKNAVKTLKEDNKKNGKPEKKPGYEIFLPMYAYIPCTSFDLRFNIPSSWKPHSFNAGKQHLEFIKRFIYPFPIPETLIWAAREAEIEINQNGERNKVKDYRLIKLSKKWICDITSGNSFYKQNKEWFTKAEAHYFLSAKIPYTDITSVLKMYYYAKCRARFFNHKLSMIFADVFTVKFHDNYVNTLIISFLDLLSRTPDYGYERGTLADLCDFVIEKINENKKYRKKQNLFSFSGRTIHSVNVLVNEWHELLRKEAEAQRILRKEAGNHLWRRNNLKEKSIDTSCWKSIGIEKFNHKTEECVWTVTELLTAKDILNEGNKMKNCVASYTYRCASGESAIFTVERIYPVTQQIDKVATLEVIPAKRILIQAKGKCNTALSAKAINIINRWAAAAGIKVQLLV